ncbi:MAG: lysophospholipid acyltransferase family protein [Myxococcota bacterium]
MSSEQTSPQLRTPVARFMYGALARFLRLVVGVFYRQIDVVGLENVPNEGPVIFAGNHPNSLHDPMLIIAYAGRVVHFAAKDVLFRSRFLRFFLTNLGAVPIARKSDHGGEVDNQATFESLYQVLAEGRAMGIFPEGLSHDEAHLMRLKTGAARIALGMIDKYPSTALTIIPCGLTYFTPKRFRSRVLLQFGPAIPVGAAWLDLHRQDDRMAARTLTEELDRALRGLTVNAPDWETARVLDGVRRLYQPKNISLEQRTELARRFNEVYPTVRERPEVQAIYAQVESYLDRLRAVGLSDRELLHELSVWEIARRIAQHLTLMFLWLPLAMPGFLLFVPLLLTIRIAGPRFSPRKDVIATTKLVLGLVMTLLVLFAVPAALVVWGSWAYGLGAFTLLALAFAATLRVLERGTAMRRLLATLTRLFSLRRDMAQLRAERAQLVEVVSAAVEAHRPADMVPLFPRDGGARAGST